MAANRRPIIRSVGHGATTAATFAALVAAAGVTTVVDVRRYPGSRRHPQFGKDEMARWLPGSGVRYRWMANLGGRRTPSVDSPNVSLRNLQFRGYADYMSSDEFGAGVADLVEVASTATVAVMCSEALWWHCHRRLLSDHLVLVEGLRVEHLLHDGRITEHPLTPGVRRAGRHVVYDAPVPDGPDLA